MPLVREECQVEPRWCGRRVSCSWGFISNWARPTIVLCFLCLPYANRCKYSKEVSSTVRAWPTDFMVQTLQVHHHCEASGKNQSLLSFCYLSGMIIWPSFPSTFPHWHQWVTILILQNFLANFMRFPPPPPLSCPLCPPALTKKHTPGGSPKTQDLNKQGWALVLFFWSQSPAVGPAWWMPWWPIYWAERPPFPEVCMRQNLAVSR
jgi:hypothetical protein